MTQDVFKRIHPLIPAPVLHQVTLTARSESELRSIHAKCKFFASSFFGLTLLLGSPLLRVASGFSTQVMECITLVSRAFPTAVTRDVAHTRLAQWHDGQPVQSALALCPIPRVRSKRHTIWAMLVLAVELARKNPTPFGSIELIAPTEGDW